MPSQPSCPNAETFSRLRAGDLDAAATASLRAHLRTCNECQSRVAAFDQGAVEDGQPPRERTRIAEYRLMRPLGRGAMGQVYLAHDERLDRTVAIKVMLRTDRQAQERFAVEARAVARLSHPNVVTIFRIGEEDGQPYLVSEYIRGEGLERLRTPLPWREALRIGLDLARGLAAAHEAGVLHRDIKPANAILAADGTARLLDFGLAKLGAASDAPAAAHQSDMAPGDAARDVSGNDGPRAMAALTRTGAMVGTPAYMPPEAWRGEPATARGDVYSLGVVLYELCAGRKPHELGGMVLLRRAVLELDALPLMDVAPGVDPRLSQVVERCLQRDPVARFADGVALREALEALALPPPPPTTPRSRAPRWLIGAALAVLPVLTILAVGLPLGALRPFVPQVRDTPTAPLAPAQRRALALLPFVTPGGPEAAWLATALPEFLAAELGASESLRPLPGERVARSLRELQVTPTVDGYDRETLARLHRHLAADLLVIGTIARDGPGLQITARVLDLRDGRQRSTRSARGAPEELFALVATLGRGLRTDLGAAVATPAELAAAAALRPASTEAARLFAEGLASLRGFDAPTARARLEQAVSADPAFALGHLALADAWDQLGSDEQARAAAARAMALAGAAPREQRLVIEARYRQTGGEGVRAIEIYRALLTFFPESVDYGLKLSEALTLQGRPREALAACAALHELPAPLGDDPRIDLEEAAASLYLSDRAGMRAALERARAEGRVRGAALVLAQADKFESYVAIYEGDLSRAFHKAEEARAAFARLGDVMGVANAESATAQALERLGDLDGAQRASEAALALQRKAGHLGAQAVELCNQGIRLLRQGQGSRARRAAEEAMAIAQRIHQKVTVINALIVLGWEATLAGQAAEAAARLDEAERLAIAQGDQLLRAWALERRGELARGRGDLAAARRHQEESLRLREAAGLTSFAAESQVLLAQLHLQAGQARKALPLARAARARFAAAGEADNLAWAQAIEGLADSALGDHAAAAVALRAAVARIQVTKNVLIRAAIAPAVARLARYDSGR